MNKTDSYSSPTKTLRDILTIHPTISIFLLKGYSSAVLALSKMNAPAYQTSFFCLVLVFSSSSQSVRM